MAAAVLPTIDALEQTFRATAEVGGSLSPKEWALPTECPGWTVQDVVSHLITFEAAALGDPPPRHELPPGLDYLRSDVHRRLEVPIDARRARSGAEVLAEFRDVTGRRIARLREQAANGEQPEVDTPFWGRRPLFDVLPTRVFDAWAHEQDIRRATGRPGGLDSPAAAITCGFLTGALPRMVRRAGLPDGTAVRFEVTGAQQIHQTVGEGEPALVVRTDWETFLRLACGRVAPERAAVTATGDPDQLRRLLAALDTTP